MTIFNTHIDLLPLADVSDEPGEPEEPDEAEQLGEPEDPQGAAGVQDLETRESVLLEQSRVETCMSPGLTSTFSSPRMLSKMRKM